MNDITNRFCVEILAFVRDELPRRHAKLQGPIEAEPDTELFRSGLLDSLAVVYLVTFLEEKLGRSLTIQEVTMERFRTARSLAETFAPQIS